MANKKISELPYINVSKISGNTLVPLVTYFSATTGDTVHTYVDDFQTYLISGLTGQTDVFVTGGTYSAGTITITNNTGGTFNITGLTTGSTTTIGGDYLPLSGGTVTGDTIFNQGLSASTISATTYLNLPITTDVFVTGGTYSNGDATFTNNTGGTFNVTGFYTGSTDIFVSGGTYSAGTITFTNTSGGTFDVTGLTTGSTSIVSGDYLPLSGGTVTGKTDFQSGVTINILTATTIVNTYLDSFYIRDNGGTLSIDNTTRRLLKSDGSTTSFDWENGILTGQTNIESSTISATTYQNLPDNVTGNYLPLSGGTVTGNTIFTSGLTANTLNVTGLTQTKGITSTGGITFKQITINSTYSATTEDYMIDASGGTFSVYLPSAIGLQGRLINIKNNGGGAVTIQPILNQTIDDKLFVILGETNALQLVSNGSNWVALGYNISTVNTSTGVFEFTGITTASTTTFTVAPVKGWIVDNTTNPLSPQLYYVSFTGGTYSSTYVTTDTETYVYLTSGGTVSQSNIQLTEQQRRQNIFLGKLSHPNKISITNVFNQPDYTLSPLSQLRDMFTPIKLINGGIRTSANGVNLSFNTSAGYLYGLGINFINDTLNPDSLYVSGTSPCTFQYRTQTGGTTSNVTLIDPTKYDVGGVVTVLPGTKATNQRIYLLQNGEFRVQYGQVSYNTLALAAAGLANEQFVEFSNLTSTGILIGILSVLSTATDLSDSTKALFFNVSKFGDSSGAAGGTPTTNLQQAYNNSINPEIITNSTLEGLQIRGGTGNDNDKNFIIENNSGVQTAWISASGDSYFNTVTATTISATTYQNLPLSATTYVSGGTYSAGTITFTNTSGGTFEVTGLTTGDTTTITGATSVGTGLTIFDSVVNRNIQINSITADTTEKITTILNSNTIELGVNEQNFTLWDLVVQGNRLLSGNVSYVSGLTFSVSPLEYLINGTIYEITSATTVTLNSGDTLYDRIDVIFADISGNTGVLEGTPSENPEKPLVDGDTQVEVTFVLVPANSTEANINRLVLYDENTGPPNEWTFGSLGVQPTRITSGNFGVAYTGNTSIRVSGVTGNYATSFRLTGSTIVDANNYGTLQFAIRNLSGNTTTSAIRFKFLTTGNTQNGSVVYMNANNNAGYVQYNNTSTSSWQLISIPLWRFYLTNTNIQVLEVSFSPSSGSQSRYYFDFFELVDGSSVLPPSNSWTTIKGDGTTTITAPNPNATLTISGGTNISSSISGTSTVVLNLDNNINLNGVTASTISASTYQNLPDNVTGNYLPLSGGTVTGSTIFNNGLFANTISATTYQNLPTDITVTGGTYSAGTITFTNTSGGTFEVTGLTTGSTSTISGDYLPLSGGTVTGNTVFTENISVTGGTGINWISGNTSTDLLRITQTGTGNAFVVEDSTNPDNTPFVINSGGSVSIGSTGVFSVGGSAETKLNVSNGSSGLATTGLSVSTPLIVESSLTTSIGMFSPDNQLSQIYFGTPSDALGSVLRWDYTKKDFSLGTSTTGGKLIFLTGTYDEVARIDQNGNFGIGLTGATQKFEVSGNSRIIGTLSANTISATTYQNLPNSLTGLYLPTSGGTVSGDTIFTSGLTASTTTINGNLTVTGNTNVRAFTGTTGYISGSGQNILTVIGSGNSTTSPLFTVQGSSGELFSVSDSLVGSLFSVNDISGLPIMEVFSDNTTLWGSYQAPSLNTTVKTSAGTGSTTVYTIPQSAYTGAFFEYTVSNTSGARAGSIMSIFSGSSVQYTETTTNDIGTTTGLTFSVSANSTNAVLLASGATAGWTIKTIVRSI